MENHLHIICLNVPYPVDYGGVFDLFYKLPTLQTLGVKIHLHCFTYGRPEQPELLKHCETVDYYKRGEGASYISLKLPYIVSTRNDERLLENLLKDNYPILMEGIHCSYLLNDKRFSDRKCFIRLHNVEFLYYEHLYKSSSFGLKKVYYRYESMLLSSYEKSICNKATFLAVSQNDVNTYKNIGCNNIKYLPLFLPQWKVAALEGKGMFCLYQGDLSVDENQRAAKWLLQEVFNNLDIPLVITGKNPPEWLSNLVYNYSNTCLVANPKEDEMQDMIRKAHVHVIPSFNATGIKLKLINALYNGRHCLVNSSTVKGTGLEEICHIADDNNSFKTLINNLMNTTFDSRETEVRTRLLKTMFDNQENGKRLIEAIFSSGLQ